MATKTKTAPQTHYENNPFQTALTGLNLVFNKARGVAILLIVVSILSTFSGSYSTPSDNPDQSGSLWTTLSSYTPQQWAVFGGVTAVIFLALIFVASMLSGISAYTSARIARGHKASLSDAFQAVLDNFFSYIWLQIITVVKILLWSLLLIIPGIIMAVRYSLANIAFFDKDLRGNAAIKESLRLTKGGWLTTFASQALFNMITLGVISELVSAGARVVLCRQFDTLGNKKKPDAHVLSWLTLFLPFVLFALLVAFIVMLAILLAVAGVVK